MAWAPRWPLQRPEPAARVAPGTWTRDAARSSSALLSTSPPSSDDDDEEGEVSDQSPLRAPRPHQGAMATDVATLGRGPCPSPSAFLSPALALCAAVALTIAALYTGVRREDAHPGQHLRSMTVPASDRDLYTVLVDCGGSQDHVDYAGDVEKLYHSKEVTADACKKKCMGTPACDVWSWGRIRNVKGLSDVCSLSVLVGEAKLVKISRYGVIAGLRSGKPCSSSLGVAKSASGHGMIKNRNGVCLHAETPGAPGSKVDMEACVETNPHQAWQYYETTGQIKNSYGICVGASKRDKDFMPVEMAPCNPQNWDQQWLYDSVTGIIKNWRGICLDAGERNIDGGMVYMRACDVDSLDQQWRIGNSTVMKQDGPPLSHLGAAGTLYCWALMIPDSYEHGLLAMQLKEKASLFNCEAYDVYSKRVIEIANGFKTQVVDSDLKCAKGGEFGTALNLDIFIAVWKKVVEVGTFREHQWTVKVDPDAVFLVPRLRKYLKIHGEGSTGTYLNNCKFGLHGPIEIFSRKAVEAWSSGWPRCKTHFEKQCGGDCFWGEDLFIDQCLQKVLKVRRDNDFRLLLEDHCEPPAGWDSCEDPVHVSFHPFKTVEGYRKCLATAESHTGASVVPAPAPTPQPALPAQSPPAPGAQEDCHTATSGEDCYTSLIWARGTGIFLHPEWYPGLSATSSLAEFQALLHGRPHVHCPKPCQ